MGRTFQCICDTVAKKKPIDSSELTSDQKLSMEAGRMIPYTSLNKSENDHIQVIMDYNAGTWYFYLPHTDILKDPDATISMSMKPWSKEELKENLITKAKELGLALNTQLAYMMATIQWETAGTFQPVREAFWMSEEWRKNNLNSYYPYYGRGYVQLTLESNYRKYSKIMGSDFVLHPDHVMEQDKALFILVHGFKNGSFTGYELEEFVNANKTDYFGARKCINGTDHAQDIADIAGTWATMV